MRALHAHSLGQLTYLAVAQEQLLLQIGTLELLARFAQRQGEQVLLHQRLVDARLHGQLALDLVEADLLAGAEHENALHEVTQLAEIPWPGIVAQAVLRSNAEAPQGQMLIVHQAVDVVAQQVRNVLGVLAQRRHPQGDDVQMRDQVAAASLGTDPAAALFGSERDGKVVQGALEQAAGGTVFLNGLEELPSQAQRALIGAIEQGGYTRVGGRERLPLNVRWVSSAQEGFESRPSPEPFRRDLIAHLNVITLRVPPLREYSEDVPDLLRNYVDRLVDDQHLPLRRFSVAAQNRLRNYPWPGNLGELRNLVQRVLVLGAGEEIRLEEIERELAAKTGVDEPLVKQDLLALPLREAREQFERAYLQQQLLLCNGKVGQLAKRVGMERTHLYRKLRALGVDFRQLGED